MAENNFIIDVIAGIQEKSSQIKLNGDIKRIQKKLNKLQLKAEINPQSIDEIKKKMDSIKVKAQLDPNAIQNLEKQLEGIVSKHTITISNINVNQGELAKAGQQAGKALGENISKDLTASLNSVKQNIANILNGLGNQKLNSYDLSKMFNLNRSGIDASVTKQVRDLTNELNSLAKEALKTNSDSAWEGIVNKINSLSDVLNKFGMNRDLSSFKESFDILNRFQGQKIFVADKSEVLQNTGMSVQELNRQFRNLNVTFTTSKKNSIELDSIWNELFNLSPGLEKFSTFGDQISAVVNHLKTAKEAMYGNSNLQPLNGKEVTNVLLGWMNGLENASKKLGILRSEQSEIEQRIAQSSTSATNTVIQNEERKRQSYRQTAREMNALNNFRVKTLPQVQDNVSNGFYSEQVGQQIEKYNRLGIELPNVKARIDELKAAEQELNSVMGNENATIEQQRTAYTNFQSALRSAKASNSIASNMYMSQDAVDGLVARLQTFMQKNSAMTNTAKTEINEWVAKLQQTGNVYKSTGNDAVAAMKRIQAEQVKVGKTNDSIFASLKKGIPMLSYWTSATYIMMSAIRGIKGMVKNVREMDEALTNISYTMDVSGRQLKQIGESSLQAAKDLHTSVSKVMDAVKTYANKTESAESIIEKSKPTIMMSNVTGMDTSQTVDILQGVMEQFDLAEDHLMHISDVMQTVSMSMPYDFANGVKELSEGIKASGSVAKDAGYDLENYTALLGTLIAKTRQSGGELGRSLRTMFVRTTKASTSALANGEVTEDDLSNAEKALRRVGIEVRSDIDTFKSFDEIMGELYKKVDSLSDVDLSNIAYEVASTRQTNVFKMMIKAYGDYQEMAEQAYNADNVTLINQEKYVESLAGKMGELSAIWQGISNDTVSSPFLKGLADAGIAVSSLIEKIGLLKTTIASVSVIAFVKNFA